MLPPPGENEQTCQSPTGELFSPPEGPPAPQSHVKVFLWGWNS